MLAADPPPIRVELAAYTLEEPPNFRSERMGSAVHAADLDSRGVRIRLMLALEMIGAFSDAPGSQGYPPVLGLFYPSQDNFIAVVNKPETLDYTRMAQVVKGVHCAVQAVARR